jgi:hypothetical protein
MRVTFRSCWSAAFLILCMQSLADIAREEAERRKLLEQQGIEGKVVEGDAAHLAPNGNLTVSTVASTGSKKPSSQISSQKDKASLRSFRSALQKLDRAIRKDEDRLKSLRARLQAERWAPPKIGRVSSRDQTTDSQDRLKSEIEELQISLKRLREERFEIYESGKKAGFLPGELDGKGIVP